MVTLVHVSMDTLQRHAGNVEVYSIDEAFFTCAENTTFQQISNLRNLIVKWCGVPIRIGVGPTKTLAKLANTYAKNVTDGVCLLDSKQVTKEVLAQTEAHSVWGIGRGYTKQLTRKKVKTALDFCNLQSNWIKKNMGMYGQVVQQELLGVQCIDLERVVPIRQSLIHSRTFPTTKRDLGDLQSTVREFTSRAAERLREHDLYAGVIQLKLSTNRHHYNYQSESLQAELSKRTRDTLVLSKHTALLTKKLFSRGQPYKRAEITLLDLSNSKQTELNLDKENTPQRDSLWKAFDRLNLRYGRNVVRCGPGSWKPRQEIMSPQYTTKVSDICVVN